MCIREKGVIFVEDEKPRQDISLEYLKNKLTIQPERLANELAAFISEKEKALHRDGVILGLSGGLDSAVAAALCVRAVGPKKVTALLMPEKDSKKEHIDDAKSIVKKLRIKSKRINMTGHLRKIGLYAVFPLDAIVPEKYRGKLVRRSYRYYEDKTGIPYFERTLAGSDTGLTDAIVNRSHAYYRAKHRMRMLLLYLYGEQKNRLVVGAANKTEYQIGYFVKHGIDSATDIMPIMGLYKTQVIQLARYLGIPENIVVKAPSPDIIPGLDDETAIGLSYEKLDLILLAVEIGWPDADIAQALSGIGVTSKDISYVRGLIRQSEHMRTVYTVDIR